MAEGRELGGGGGYASQSASAWQAAAETAADGAQAQVLRSDPVWRASRSPWRRRRGRRSECARAEAAEAVQLRYRGDGSNCLNHTSVSLRNLQRQFIRLFESR